MNDIQKEYKRRNRIGFYLILAMIVDMGLMGLIFQKGEHKPNIIEIMMMLSIAIMIGALYITNKCPKCKKYLGANNTIFTKTKYCAGCGEKLSE